MDIIIPSLLVGVVALAGLWLAVRPRDRDRYAPPPRRAEPTLPSTTWSSTPVFDCDTSSSSACSDGGGEICD